MESNERFTTDLDVIADAHRLSAGERTELVRVIAGAIPGNRDRTLFLLARRMSATGSGDMLSLILPETVGLRRFDRALLDFLVTAALETAEGFEGLVAAFQATRSAPDPARAFVPALGVVLHAYRSRVFPESRYHNVFTAVRRFLAECRAEDPWPRDGDAPRFWEAEGRRDLLTRYVTALRALADYAEAARLAETWRDPVSLDDPDAFAEPSSTFETEAEDHTAYSQQLADNLKILGSAPLKLMLAHERETLAALVDHADLVLRWPGDVQAALTMGPVQNAITQVLRRRQVVEDISSLMDRGPSCPEVIAQLEALAESLTACLHLIHRSRPPPPETPSGRSSPSSVYGKRIAAMERRKGFDDLTAAIRAEVLTELIEPVLLLKAMVERYHRAWMSLGPDRCAALERTHRTLFSRKFAVLYDTRAEE